MDEMLLQEVENKLEILTLTRKLLDPKHKFNSIQDIVFIQYDSRGTVKSQKSIVVLLGHKTQWPIRVKNKLFRILLRISILNHGSLLILNITIKSFIQLSKRIKSIKLRFTEPDSFANN
ncbi:hypothetical protein BpHYR1_037953 [Brachionus plicatilis]|uniref:Uncharacterized protein n=1 Tax=Brachionus plicatilis TaxID=10195 RepID=A0A3M7QE20_BRAPC|nr:hypothetical protein BpHYR1_037953 [Brachionus plicatilis]